MKPWLVGFGAFAALATITGAGWAYVFNGAHWTAGSTVTMQMQMGSSSISLRDGATSWNEVGEWALAAWNGYANIAFGIVRNSSAGTGMRNGNNNAYFSSTTPTGDSFGDGVLATTITSYNSRTGLSSEADVTFNTKYTWNSYRGNLSSGTVDVYRVAVHEFGHVLGLDHPDQAGQSRTAIMNAYVSNVDRLQTDDVNGIVALYGSAPASNRTPSVTASCSPCSVASGRAVTLSASASDPDGDSLSYAWSISSGSLGNSGSSSTTWLAPFTLGTSLRRSP